MLLITTRFPYNDLRDVCGCFLSLFVQKWRISCSFSAFCRKKNHQSSPDMSSKASSKSMSMSWPKGLELQSQRRKVVPRLDSFLVGGFSPTHLKNMRSRQIGSFPRVSGWKFKKMFETIKLPPTVVDHQRLKLHNFFCQWCFLLKTMDRGNMSSWVNFFALLSRWKFPNLPRWNIC